MMSSNKALVPKLRFPEFRDTGEWNSNLVKDLISTVPPPRKLTSDLYEDEGQFPVIDQSQEYICGWTNDEGALIPTHSPLVIFGDHTCVLKLVKRSFAQGADGIKILKANDDIDPEYLYQHLLCFPVSMESYKRHFSVLKERIVTYPKKKSGEQQKIVNCLSSLDAQIAAQADKIDALKAHKKGLMQQLFPRDGETVPRLRFPEFENAGEWSSLDLGGLCKIRTGKKDANEGVEDGVYPFYTCAEKHIYSNDYSFDTEAILIAGNANVGQTSYYNGKFEAYQRTYVLTNFRDIFVPYLYAVLSANLRHDLLAQVQTSAMSYIRLSTLEEYRISAPLSIDEQRRVADCLSSLDSVIAVQANKLNVLKDHKKGLMQHLFPYTGPVVA